MEHRKLGNSGLYISEISYGNWITHGSQVEQDAAIKCVRAAIDLGITTFDTADVYAATKAETILGKALKGVRRESYELFTKFIGQLALEKMIAVYPVSTLWNLAMHH